MCGRFTYLLTWREIVALYRLTDPPAERAPNLQLRYNVCPTQDVAIVRAMPDGGCQLAFVRWGLIPFWAKDVKSGYSTINARAETVATKPAFGEAYKQRRCIVPASGFYEWQPQDGGKQPFYVASVDGAPLSFAGLWERWRDAERGEEIESYTIIVCGANERLSPLHDRMPVILAPEDVDQWLDPALSTERAGELLRPCPPELLKVYPVSRTVNSPRSDVPECIKPIAYPAAVASGQLA